MKKLTSILLVAIFLIGLCACGTAGETVPNVQMSDNTNNSSTTTEYIFVAAKRNIPAQTLITEDNINDYFTSYTEQYEMAANLISDTGVMKWQYLKETALGAWTNTEIEKDSFIKIEWFSHTPPLFYHLELVTELGETKLYCVFDNVTENEFLQCFNITQDDINKEKALCESAGLTFNIKLSMTSETTYNSEIDASTLSLQGKRAFILDRQSNSMRITPETIYSLLADDNQAQHFYQVHYVTFQYGQKRAENSRDGISHID